MAGPTWLIHPGWGELAHSWRGRGHLHALHRGSLTLKSALRLYSYCKTTAAVSQHTQRPGRRHLALGWLCAKFGACTFGAGLATHSCCNPSHQSQY